MRDNRSRIFSNSIVQNKWVWGAIVLCLLLILGALYIAPIAEVMKLSPPSRQGWMVVGVLSLIPLVTGQLQKSLAVRFQEAKA